MKKRITTASGNSELDRLCEEAGVDPKDVKWRIRPGFTAKQAIEVAVNEKLERGG